MNTGVLEAITAAAKRSADGREQMSGEAVRAAAARRTPRGDAFVAALSAPGVSIIAECKRRSPSRGILRDPYDPAAIATGYVAGGAAAISVLTETAFFDGDLAHLAAVREQVHVPLLRKDFISTPFQIAEARANGADAVLLIVAGLSTGTLKHLMNESAGHGLAALVEVHSRLELDQALSAGARVVGVNSRNLKTLDVDLGVFDQLVGNIPDDVIAVAESGIRTATDIHRLGAAGYDAFLIGERFMTAPDPGAALSALLALPEEGASPCPPLA